MNKTITLLKSVLGESFDKYTYRDEVAFMNKQGMKIDLTISDLLENGIVEKYYDIEHLICDKDYSPKAIEIDGYYYIVNIIVMYRWI